MSTILHLNLGERLLIANVSADVKGASSVIRTVRRVRHAISARELLDRKVSLSEIGDVDGDLTECDFPPDAFEWLVKTYKRRGKWYAQIKTKGETKSLGYFSCKEDAARAYNEAAKKHHGPFAWLNKILSF